MIYSSTNVAVLNLYAWQMFWLSVQKTQGTFLTFAVPASDAAKVMFF
jgi:hypothetical protein